MSGEKIVIAEFSILPKHAERVVASVTYWGVYLDGKLISYTSSEELAEKTKKWMKKWLGPDGNPPLFL